MSPENTIKEEQLEEEKQFDRRVGQIALLCNQRMFRRIAFPYSQIKYLRNFESSRQLLVGCLLACKMLGTKMVLIDEILLLNSSSISFKHSSSVVYVIDDLEDVELTRERYQNWTKDMAKWGEPLSTFIEYDKRRKRVYEERREQKEKGESGGKRKRKRTHGRHSQLEEGQIVGDGVNGATDRGQTEDDGHGATAAEEPPLDALVHSIGMLRKTIFPFAEMKYLAKKGHESIHPLLIGCLTVCTVKKAPKNVIVGDVALISRNNIVFKQMPSTIYHLDHLDGIKVTENIFRAWIDDLVRKGVRLPLSEPYQRLRANILHVRSDNGGRWMTSDDGGTVATALNKPTVVNGWAENAPKTKKQNWGGERGPTTPTFVQTFGNILSCVVNPLHFVHLQQLGQEEFGHVAVGLYVRCKVGQRCSIERIRKVTWDVMPPYQVCDQPMNARLHFDGRNCAPPALIVDVQFPSMAMDSQVVEHQQRYRTFCPPSGDHIARKSVQLQNALYKLGLL